MNIFAPLDSTVNQEPTFWQSVPPDFDTNQAVSKHFGVLQVAEGELDIEVSQFALVDCMLYKFKGSWENPSSISMVDLRWKIAEPFFEENEEEEPIYGFCLKSQDFMVEFYAEDTNALDGWLNHLSNICILNGFEDDFNIVEVVGQGSTATVFHATGSDDHESYAVKQISKALLIDSAQTYKSMANEIEVLRTIKHPNVLKMFRIYELENYVCLILEYLPHGNLANRLQQRSVFSEEAACRLVWALLDTVEHLHDNNILHRDLKLENILMVKPDDDMEFRIADFGLAIQDTAEGLKLRSGSPGYIAPEILENRPYGKKVDVFSTGIVLYSLLTGKLPFYSPDIRATIELNARCELDFNTAELRQVTIESLAVVKALTQRSPENRPTAQAAKSATWFSRDAKVLDLANKRRRQTAPAMRHPGLYKRSPMTFQEETKAIEFRSSSFVHRVSYLSRLRTTHPEQFTNRLSTFTMDQIN
jgi:calcium/calmodulin-dependent protein kinase I